MDIVLCLSRPVGAAVMPISPGVSHGDMRNIQRLVDAVDAFIAREGLEHPLCELLDELVDVVLCLSRDRRIDARHESSQSRDGLHGRRGSGNHRGDIEDSRVVRSTDAHHARLDPGHRSEHGEGVSSRFF